MAFVHGGQPLLNPVVTLAPLALVSWRRQPIVVALAFVAIGVTVAWLASYQILPFLIPIYPFAALLTGGFTGGLTLYKTRLAAWAPVLVVLAAVVFAVVSTRSVLDTRPRNSLAYVTGRESTHACLAST